MSATLAAALVASRRACVVVNLKMCIVVAPVSGQFPLLHSVTVQALALSSCGDWDNPAGDTVGLLCLGAMGSKPDDLFAVGALAKCAKGTCHVFGRLGGANQNGAALGCSAVLGGVHWHHYDNRETVGGESVGLLYIIGAQVDSKAPSCSVACPLDSVRAVLVGVRKPVTASVGFDNLSECVGVHPFTLSR
jgi:hypothetical protein